MQLLSIRKVIFKSIKKHHEYAIISFYSEGYCDQHNRKHFLIKSEIKQHIHRIKDEIYGLCASVKTKVLSTVFIINM